MIIEIENNAESLLKIEYKDKLYDIASNSISQIEVDALEFSLSAYLIMPKNFDLELDKNGIKEKIIQKSFDALYSLSKKLIVQCKTTYAIKLNSNNARLIFDFGIYGKEQNFAKEFFDMPAEITGFARLECDCADIKVTDCESINKKQFFKIYKKMYWWINWNLGLLFAIFAYLPSYFKQKQLVSKKHLTKLISGFYLVPKEEREKILFKVKDLTNNESTQDPNDSLPKDEENNKKGCVKVFIQIGIFVLILIGLVIFGIAFIITHIR